MICRTLLRLNSQVIRGFITCVRRKFVVGGNWKMNGNKAQIDKIIDFMNEGPIDEVPQIIVGVPAIYLEYVRNNLSDRFEVAAQNCYKERKGAFTGEISTDMLKDIGVDWVILGHSERRHVFGESNKLVGEKILHALKQGINVIACVGETLEERRAHKTEKVIVEQLREFGKDLSDWSKVIIAYEPVWAIGTGQTATPEQAQEVHLAIRNWILAKAGKAPGLMVQIQYGGSVTASNCKELAAQKDIDGFLVGGASLKKEFIDIINCKQCDK